MHGYQVQAALPNRAFLYLRHVAEGGLGLYTRQWAPDGPPAACPETTVTTAPLYQAGAFYHLADFSRASGQTTAREVKADSTGKLTIATDCSGHEIGIDGPGTGSQPPVLLPMTESDVLRLPPDTVISLPVRFFNPRSAAMKDIRTELSSDYPTVAILQGTSRIPSLAPGAVAAPATPLQIRLAAGEGDFAHARLHLKISGPDVAASEQDIDILIQPRNIPAPLEIAILDGRTQSFPVFRQKGNQGGGSSVQRTVTEGQGNGNGILEPGEQATIWVRVRQGMDPFDTGNWRRAKVYSPSPWLTEIGDIQENKQLEWTGAQNRTSLVRLAPETPPGTAIPLVLDCEEWTYHFTPDVRFGAEPLYQAFQFHRHQLFAWTWRHP